jgi:hypothetical protein
MQNFHGQGLIREAGTRSCNLQYKIEGLFAKLPRTSTVQIGRGEKHQKKGGDLIPPVGDSNPGAPRW